MFRPSGAIMIFPTRCWNTLVRAQVFVRAEARLRGGIEAAATALLIRKSDLSPKLIQHCTLRASAPLREPNFFS
jgi:hypothetical protein